VCEVEWTAKEQDQLMDTRNVRWAFALGYWIPNELAVDVTLSPI